MVIGRYRSSTCSARGKLNFGKFGSLTVTCGTAKPRHARPRRKAGRNLEAAPAPALRTEFQGVRQREQEACATRFVVRRPVAQWEGHADIGLQTIPQKKSNAAACRSQREAVVELESVIPGRAGIDEAIELIAAQISIAELLIEAQFERAGDAVVTADLGTAIAPPEILASQIELLRSELWA
jgi:hypothetical protein